ncbi:hypothetical protein LVD17_07115 [Fulvivirga ulvae]|uniref:hypothetical protein n=1 Tax=Fulvivirga ulvae TaxID=2904245 RepID=UPI001F2E43C6|nr:hypothetical protein [Fulvivirga ulvae]UII33587.1 hypothetical protein LVD17_07115 [Fulvivirga ulvae]
MPHTIDDFNKWIPVAFDAEKEEVQWIYAGDKDFREPFFEDDIRLIRYESPKSKNTSLHEFNKLGASKRTDTIKPALFIFHISRCGSTLITQMLAQSAKNIVYSEPPLTDEILSSDLSHDVKMKTLRAAIILMGQKRKAPHQYLFIKWDSWHLAYYGLIRQAFPGVPAIFLYREPVEVLQSHQRVRGMHMVPGLLKKDVFQLKGIPAHDLDLYAANVLSKLYGWMLLHAENKLVRLVNYSELPGRLFDVITDMRLEYSPDERKAMEERSKRHSKQGWCNTIYNTEEYAYKLQGWLLIVKERYERLEEVR